MSGQQTEVPVANHELIRALTGHPIAVRTLDGDDVLLRLATPDEVQQFELDARASLAEKGVTVDAPLMTRERAEDLCRPLLWDGDR